MGVAGFVSIYQEVGGINEEPGSFVPDILIL